MMTNDSMDRAREEKDREIATANKNALWYRKELHEAEAEIAKLKAENDSLRSLLKECEETIKYSVLTTTNPTMDDPFNNNWVWFYRLEELLSKLKSMKGGGE